MLACLIAFASVSRDPNRPLIDWIAEVLAGAGIDSVVIPDETGGKANLFATIGPQVSGGVMLSGHTDVVPVDGQDWTYPPFELTEDGGRLYGRGTADMKGFVASAMRAALRAADADLKVPLYLAFSYDEELGCLGVPSLIEHLRLSPFKPSLCIVGEPTAMAVATGHKGKTAFRAMCKGLEGHSALAPMALNALHLGCDYVAGLRAIQADIEAQGDRDGDYDVPYSTVHVGKMSGGVALNIVPNNCVVDFEVRNLATEATEGFEARFAALADTLTAEARTRAPDTGVTLSRLFGYPGLNTDQASEAVAFVKSLTGANGTIKVAFGTEAGLFSAELGIPCVVCGPGSMAQGHKPDEFVTLEQLDRCDAMLDGLVERLIEGF